jgi:hypothetical protein
MEDMGMFHDILPFLNEHVPLSTTFVASSSDSFVHLPLPLIAMVASNFVQLCFYNVLCKIDMFLVDC